MGFESITVISWPSLESCSVRATPTLPSPTIMICIFPSLFPPAAQINAVLKFFQRY